MGRYEMKEAVIRLVEGRSLYSDTKVRDAEAAVELLKNELSGYDRETLCAINLNTKLQPINYHVVSVGNLKISLADIANIFKSGILSNAFCLILIHNHPSGDPTPSESDLDTTKRVIEAGRLIGIPCFDSVIIGGGNGSYYSMMEHRDFEFDKDSVMSFAAGRS